MLYAHGILLFGMRTKTSQPSTDLMRSNAFLAATLFCSDGWNRVNGQSVTVQTSHAVVNPLKFSASCVTAKVVPS